MTIASEITKLNTNLTNSYTACQNKNATMPASENFDNLPTAINSITELKGETKTVTPSTSQQTITPSSGKNGITQVTVNAVTSAIDSDIKASNIKSGVNILGVSGTVTELAGETRTVSITSTSGNTFTPSSGKNGITSIKVNPTNQNRTVTPSTTSQTLSVNSGYSGNGTISVSAVTSTIDQNIQPENIKKDTVILGITGTYEGSSGSFTGINREVVNGVYKVPTSSFIWSLPSTATDVGSFALYYAFYGSTGLTSADLSSLTTINGGSALNSAFYGCRNLTSADLSSLTTLSGDYAMQYAFNGCTNLTSVDLSSLTTVSGNYAMDYAFSSCTKLTSVLFTNLTTIGVNSSSVNYGHFSYCFSNCKNLTSITFPKLEKIYCTGGTNGNGTFAGNNKVQKLYFPKLDTITYGSGASTTNQNACKNVFSGCSALTELHFGATNQSAIQSSPGYSTAWGRGAGNVTIYFDL